MLWQYEYARGNCLHWSWDIVKTFGSCVCNIQHKIHSSISLFTESGLCSMLSLLYSFVHLDTDFARYFFFNFFCYSDFFFERFAWLYGSRFVLSVDQGLIFLYITQDHLTIQTETSFFRYLRFNVVHQCAFRIFIIRKFTLNSRALYVLFQGNKQPRKNENKQKKNSIFFLRF